jgi:serine/threonine protein kinase
MDYTEIHKLGSGRFGEVVLAKNTNEDLFSIKKIKIDNYAVNEISISKKLKGIKNVVEFIDSYTKDDYYHIVYEFINGESLLDLMKDKNLSYQDSLDVIEQLIDGLYYIHDKNIAHMDIKPENVMTSIIDNKISIKYIDFGLSCDEQPKMSKKICGSVPYLSRESLFLIDIKGIDDAKCRDIWSLGVLLYEFMHGENIFPNNPEGDIPIPECVRKMKIYFFYGWVKPEVKIGCQLPNTQYENINKFLIYILEINAKDRKNISQIREKFFQLK